MHHMIHISPLHSVHRSSQIQNIPLFIRRLLQCRNFRLIRELDNVTQQPLSLLPIRTPDILRRTMGFSMRIGGVFSSRRPIITFPATSKAAPTHHSGGRDSVKMMKPRMAVIMKFAEVLIMETWVVEVPRARALVKRAHIWRRMLVLG